MATKPGKHCLIDIEWPDFGVGACPPRPSAAALQMRLDSLREKMDEQKYTHVAVYGDREHFANLAYLTGFDPRFEESLLIVGRAGKPLILVGNECEGYLTISSLLQAGQLRYEVFQSFSLLGQPRERSRALSQILADEGMGAGSRVGVVGYKYFLEDEHPDAAHTLDVPSFIADAIRGHAGAEQVCNATDLFMHPGYGLRAKCSVSEIAYFEYSNGRAAESVKRMIFGLQEGMTDHAVIEASGINGDPLSCHVTFGTGNSAAFGMAGPSGEIIRRDQPLAFNLAYWGSNICRAGWIATGAEDLPEAAKDYVSAFAGPYFEALGEWFGLMKAGTPGQVVYDMIHEHLPFEQFGVYLNPGHLIHLDEWMSSPFFAGSTIPVKSGMAIQVDVIPASKRYFSTRMEDGIVIAGEELRTELKAAYPECYARCQARRTFMTGTLGIELPEEVLPLSNTCAIVPPFFLRPNRVLALKG